MTQTHETTTGQREMMQVRHRRRFTLCQILTLIGVLFLFALGSLSLYNQALLLGSILISSALVGLVNLYLLKRTGNVERAAIVLSGILFVLCMSLLITGGKDNTGMLWIYPIAAINLFINRFWPAVVVFFIFSITSVLLLFTPLSSLLMTSYTLVEAIRFILTTLALNLICLAALRSEEQSYETIIKLHDDDIRQMAFYDTLTGLPNRWNFKTNLQRVIDRATKDKQKVGLLYIDLDNFKQVNDQYGHEMGDKLLLKFSEELFQDRFNSSQEDVVKALSNNAASPNLLTTTAKSGLAGDVAAAAYGILKSTGVVSAMNDAFEAKKERIETKQVNLDSYIERITAQYEKQFSALNGVLASFKDTQEQLQRSLNLNNDN